MNLSSGAGKNRPSPESSGRIRVTRGATPSGASRCFDSRSALGSSRCCQIAALVEQRHDRGLGGVVTIDRKCPSFAVGFAGGLFAKATGHRFDLMRREGVCDQGVAVLIYVSLGLGEISSTYG